MEGGWRGDGIEVGRGGGMREALQGSEVGGGEYDIKFLQKKGVL